MPGLSYEDTKQIMERRLAQQKRGILTKSEINHIVKDWGDQRVEEDLVTAAIKREVKRLEKRFKRYSVSVQGSIPNNKQEDRCRMLYCQLKKMLQQRKRER